MDEQLKKRLVGAAVLASLVIIFLPMILDENPIPERGMSGQVVPKSPVEDGIFRNKASQPNDPGRQLSIRRPNLTPVVPVGPEEQAAAATPAAPAASRAEPVVQTPPPAPTKAPESAAVQKPATPVVKPSESKSIESKPAEQKPAEPGGALRAWAIQVASFPSRDSAQALIAELRGHRFAAFLQEANINQKSWYRVRVGPEADRKRIDAELTRLQAQLAGRPISPQVVRHP